MQYFIFTLLCVPFGYINYKIILSDFKRKIIPNKYLLKLMYLVPLFYIYFFFFGGEIHYFLFIVQILATLIVSFLLYYFGVWSAGDAKYLLVLTLFIPQIGIIPFIGNIAVITLVYLLGYFLRFYFGKCLLSWEYSKSLYNEIFRHLQDKFTIHREKKGGKTVIVVLRWILAFLIIFVGIRLARFYIFDSIFENPNNGKFFSQTLEKYHIYLTITVGIFFIGFFQIARWIIQRIKRIINKNIVFKFNIRSHNVDYIFLLFSILLLTSFIFYEYRIDSEELLNHLYKIFTLYIALWLIFRIIFFSFKITFGLSENYYINITHLKEGDIVDKQYLMKLFGDQICLGAIKNPDEVQERKKYLLFPDPKVYFQNIENPIDKKTKNKIKKIYSIVNNYHKKRVPNYSENSTIRVLYTFSFAIYIFTGFCMSFIYGNEIFLYLIHLGKQVFIFTNSN